MLYSKKNKIDRRVEQNLKRKFMTRIFERS